MLQFLRSTPLCGFGAKGTRFVMCILHRLDFSIMADWVELLHLSYFDNGKLGDDTTFPLQELTSSLNVITFLTAFWWFDNALSFHHAQVCRHWKICLTPYRLQTDLFVVTCSRYQSIANLLLPKLEVTVRVSLRQQRKTFPLTRLWFGSFPASTST